MKQSGIAIVVLLALGLSACTEAPQDESGVSPEGGLLDDQQRVLERARTVEEEVLEAARRQRENIERQSGSGSADGG